MQRKYFFVLMVFVVLLLDSRALWTQIPDKFENLQVLPKDVTKKELVDIMKGFTSGLGQSCEYCHVGKGRDLSTFDFASDDKLPKKTARLMIQMSNAINQKYLKEIPSTSKTRISVTCSTCHHGQARPEPIENLIRGELDQAGIESAVKKYRNLRDQFYGDYVFDFTEGPLNRLATEFAQKDRLSDAIALLKLNAEFYPRSAWLELVMAEVLLKNGMKEDALQHYRKSLELDPENEWLKKKIEEISSSATEE
ncbi:c-type cytochrome [bacterium]|nr:c-type cytochrome [bacterium]MCI0611854.1 c-type cytochrome [bacterium]